MSFSLAPTARDCRMSRTYGMGRAAWGPSNSNDARSVSHVTDCMR